MVVGCVAVERKRDLRDNAGNRSKVDSGQPPCGSDGLAGGVERREGKAVPRRTEVIDSTPPSSGTPVERDDSSPCDAGPTIAGITAVRRSFYTPFIRDRTGETVPGHGCRAGIVELAERVAQSLGIGKCGRCLHHLACLHFFLCTNSTTACSSLLESGDLSRRALNRSMAMTPWGSVSFVVLCISGLFRNVA